MKKKRYLYLLSAAVLLLASGFASAAVIEMNHSSSNGLKIDYTIFNGTTDLDRNGWWAGQFSPVRLDFDSNDVNVFNPDLTTISYCVDVLEFTKSGGEKYVVDLQSAVGKGDNYRNAAWLMETYSSTVSTAAEMAGLQVAIWEVVYDHGSHNLTDGNFKLDSGGDVLTNATSYLAALALNTDFTGLDHYMIAHSDGKQDQLIATPIPMAAWLFGSGLLGLIGFRKRAAKV
jgi:hypothetical protein